MDSFLINIAMSDSDSDTNSSNASFQEAFETFTSINYTSDMENTRLRSWRQSVTSSIQQLFQTKQFFAEIEFSRIRVNLQ